jgi:hypothetical protein
MRKSISALFLMLALGLTACGGGPSDPQNLACARQSPDGTRWGYYPGYGCGPVPRAQTNFS